MSWPVTATYEDGSSETFETMDDVPVEKTAELLGPAHDGGFAMAYANLKEGETVRRHQTRVLRMGTDEVLSISTFTIFRHGKPVAYMYIAPDGVPRLSTRELTWL